MNYAFLVTVLAVVIIVLVIASFTNFRLDDAHYDRLKWVVVRWSYLVAFIALIVKVFGMPYGMETVLVVSGFGIMLAGIMGVSTKNYKSEKMTRILNEDLLKDMLGFDADLHLIGELESEEEEEETEESED